MLAHRRDRRLLQQQVGAGLYGVDRDRQVGVRRGADHHDVRTGLGEHPAVVVEDRHAADGRVGLVDDRLPVAQPDEPNPSGGGERVDAPPVRDPVPARPDQCHLRSAPQRFADHPAARTVAATPWRSSAVRRIQAAGTSAAQRGFAPARRRSVIVPSSRYGSFWVRPWRPAGFGARAGVGEPFERDLAVPDRGLPSRWVQRRGGILGDEALQ